MWTGMPASDHLALIADRWLAMADEEVLLASRNCKYASNIKGDKLRIFNFMKIVKATNNLNILL